MSRLRVVAAVASVGFLVLIARSLMPDQGPSVAYRFLARILGANAEQEAAWRRYWAVSDTLWQVDQHLREARLHARARTTDPGAGAGVVVLADGAHPERDRATLERFAREELAAAGVTAVRHPIKIVLARRDSSVTWPMYNRAAVLPARTGEPCTIVYAPNGRQRPVVVGNADRLLGACAFYAQYGAPGAGMRAWLRETGQRRGAVALLPTFWEDGVLREATASNAAMRVPYLALCRERPGVACDSLFLGREPDQRATSAYRDRVVLESPVEDIYLSQPSAFAGRTTPVTLGLLQGLAEQMGPEDFGRFWTAAEPPTEAYEGVMGRSLATAVHELVRTRVPEARSESSLRPAQWVAPLLLTALLIAIGLRLPSREIS